MSRFCVTGGAGFIGSHLVDYLARLREEVVVLDDLSSGSLANIASVADRVRVVQGSICDAAAVADALAGCDYVLHQAALTSVPRSIEAPEEYYRVNVMGTLQLLEGARAAGVKRVVLASSSSVYGDGDDSDPGADARSPKHESQLPAPLSPYAASKAANEHQAALYSATLGLECVAVRYFNVFGPRQAPDSPYAAVIPKFAAAMLQGELPVIYGDGEQTRDFTYVENIVKGNILAVRNGTPGRLYNIACGTPSSVKQLLRMVASGLGAPAKARTQPARPGDIVHSTADITRAREELGFAPPVDLETGLRKTLEWYRNAAKVGA